MVRTVIQSLDTLSWCLEPHLRQNVVVRIVMQRAHCSSRPDPGMYSWLAVSQNAIVWRLYVNHQLWNLVEELVLCKVAGWALGRGGHEPAEV